MAYQVIARKWRPQTFADLVGQTHITQTLANALKTGRVHHALLFTGPRGTGKTSSARILAKSLRCPNAVDFVPCNTCTSCMEIAQSRSMDVQELDAASNNSVDDVRKLLDGVMSAPSSGRWKIYIIDEVHMLSTSAFNALLKTLEEPPAHVMFILATTEVHKIPETILSRCLRFDFKRISTRTVTDRLKTISDAEGIKADEDALWLIARQGDGSMRDSLSLLDQVITFTSGQITKETVTRILGLTDRGLLFETLNNLVARDTHGMLKVLEGLGQSGLEPRLFVNEMLETLRNVLVIRISGAEMNGILDLPDSEMKFLAEIGSQMTEEETHFLFDMALKGANEIPRSPDPRLVLEVLLLRMAAAPRIMDLQSLLSQQPQARGDLQQSPIAPRKAQIPATPSAVEAPAPPKPVLKAQGKTPEDRWLNFVELVRNDDKLFAAKLEKLLFSGEQGKTLKLAIPPKLVFLKEQWSDQEARKKLKGLIDSLWGEGYSFEVVAGQSAPAGTSASTLAAEKRQVEDEDMKVRVAEHPRVKAAQMIFQGQIKSITTVKEGVKK